MPKNRLIKALKNRRKKKKVGVKPIRASATDFWYRYRGQPTDE